MRILCYAQHLSGVGHFVRMEAIARGLAVVHDVRLIDGGRPVPRCDGGAPPRVALPVIHRGPDGLVASAGGLLADALAERAVRLRCAVEELRPDVVLVDHYPFSKWELESEILAMLAAARRIEPGVRVLCSLRDIAPRTAHDRPDDGCTWDGLVAARLAEYFAGVLVHADPTFTRIEEHVPWAAAPPVPVHYTGFVAAEAAGEAPGTTAPYAVLSCGGGVRSLPFLRAALAAFATARAAGRLGGIRLRVFPGLFASPADLAALRTAVSADVAVEPFSPEFGRVLAGSALSISRAGYNTTVQLLQAGVPAVVVPDAGMSDQPPRARRLAARGLAVVVEGDPPDPAALVAAMDQALRQPSGVHDLDLDGVRGTRTVIERLHAERAG